MEVIHVALETMTRAQERRAESLAGKSDEELWDILANSLGELAAPPGFLTGYDSP